MLTAAALQSILDEVAAEYVKRLGLRVDAVDQDSVSLNLPVTADLVHGGGVLCGQAIMAAADTAMLVAMIGRLGGFRPMTTVQMQTSFLRPVANDVESVSLVSRVLRLGKTLSYGEVAFSTPDGRLAAHATMTYSLIRA